MPGRRVPELPHFLQFAGLGCDRTGHERVTDWVTRGATANTQVLENLLAQDDGLEMQPRPAIRDAPERVDAEALFEQALQMLVGME